MKDLSCGIVGLPNVGKSTLFNALLKKIKATASNFPFCTIEPNIGIVNLPDDRLSVLSTISKSKKIIPATVTFVDIAGLVKGAASGQGLGNKFLSNIRQTDVILHVVRCFEDDNITHVEGTIDPINDIEVIELELILADLQMVENSLIKLQKKARMQRDLDPMIAALKKAEAHLSDNKKVINLELTKEEQELIKPYHFITNKKTLYVANVAEDEVANPTSDMFKKVVDYAEKCGSKVLPICAKLEEELAALSEDEVAEFLTSMDIEQTGLSNLISTSFFTLGLVTFFTTGEMETRAWTIQKGMRAPQAAGRIHSDIEKGFIRAEVVHYNALKECGNKARAKEQGRLQMEGKDYVVADGDVVLFHHS
ncbi:redox-regulated ATPase YchF [Candidatus Aerophobetes bacterium]|uniref:Ribosome-binding ATPase YchF n=1 Tax=Aerophobetes bacterium TaxID=2030807 RepID=A0A2A4X5R0_UNCAE|nr:MAG: redox-regulated ATPase YchF [Candidatus Aerophobetes bacterium]